MARYRRISVEQAKRSSAKSKSASIRTGMAKYNSAMPKRNLRIVKRSANIPVLGICEYCNAQFSADPTGRTVEGQAAIQEQFDAHKCKRLDASQNAVRVVRESTEGK